MAQALSFPVINRIAATSSRTFSLGGNAELSLRKRMVIELLSLKFCETDVEIASNGSKRLFERATAMLHNEIVNYSRCSLPTDRVPPSKHQPRLCPRRRRTSPVYPFVLSKQFYLIGYMAGVTAPDALEL
jgi:hypothetical protein